ncbi:PREDICTED: uncharacterized protein LOC108761912 [Trachymyrmex cornetzi]|uniref:uncharacterized protein LOC108761912 n=1 Tax=Trachymyrmex cornetzi TaxID=471704 RepID=UPI00084F85E6|nr:PREDICTED: uncharacterized protein LOC108761912 [Trachymyrmex cornetzi]
MRIKYNFNLLFIQMATILLFVNFVAAHLLEKLTEMTLTEGTSKQERASDILSMGQYFQDIFSEHLAPLKLEFGYVCENPIEWEQRFERKDFDNNRFSGKVKWGNKNGEYGEQYWDLNH